MRGACVEQGERGTQLLKSIDQEAFSLLEDRTRRRMLLLLRENELSAKDIAPRAPSANLWRALLNSY
ncbi:MAG: hypothetical protein WC941_03140 [Candidatus Bathyarchaeia archaeon]